MLKTFLVVVHGAGEAEWIKIHKTLKTFIRNAANALPDRGDGTVAFIDTNPSLSIWTQMALAAGNKLIIPVNHTPTDVKSVVPVSVVQPFSERTYQPFTVKNVRL